MWFQSLNIQTRVEMCFNPVEIIKDIHCWDDQPWEGECSRSWGVVSGK